MAVRASLLVALFAAFLLVLDPGRAAAATRLVTAYPADGVALDRAPDAVVLTFSAPPDLALSHVSTRDSAGRDVGGPMLTRTGRTGLRLAVTIRANGDYTTAYHVVAADGTEVVGVLRFSVGTGVPPLGAAGARPSPPSALDDHHHGVDPISAALLALDLAVFIGVVLLLLRRPRARITRAGVGAE